VRISNFKFQISNFQKGFTLIELLVVIMVLTTVGLVVGNIISVSLRGANKVNTLTSVKQNGNYTMYQIGKVLRYAKSLDEVDGNKNYNCIVESVGNLTPTPTPAIHASIKVTLLDDTQTIFSCDSIQKTITTTTLPASTTPTPYSLLDTSVQIAPTSQPTPGYTPVSTCYFTCYQKNPLDPPRINFSFSLSQVNTSAFFENKATVPFETSITLRNAIR